MKTKILILAANPKDTPRLRLEEEVREIDNGLTRSKKRNEFVLEQKLAVRPQDLRRAMLDFNPNIVHFCGHGEGKTGIIFENEVGHKQEVSGEALSNFFKLFADQVDCILLNACYSEVHAKAIVQHIDYVIGVEKEIGDKAAIEFSVAFYDALGAGRSIKFAYEMACSAIQIQGVKAHLTPLLLSGNKSTEQIKSEQFSSADKIDWGNAPDISLFFGRESELDIIKNMIIGENCRLIAILGIAGIGKTRLSIKLGKGGIGKTDLTVKLAKGIQDHFDYIVWRRLINAPPISELLSDIIKLISDQKIIDVPDDVSDQISIFLNYLKRNKCLIIFDNVEAILKGGNESGKYREGYEYYGELFKQIGEVLHKSCLIITSREKPYEISCLEGDKKPVRSLELKGLDKSAGKKIFESMGSYIASDNEWEQLIEFYDGNPLALELAANHIKEVFFGNVSDFLAQGKPLFNDLNDLLNWHFNRLSDLEKEVMYWLAINREPISFFELKEDIISPLSKEQISSTLQSLQRRIPLEKSFSRFALQPVLVEYLTRCLIEQIKNEITVGDYKVIEYIIKPVVEQSGEEIRGEKLALLNSHALLKALAKDYVRESQIRIILKPLIKRLLEKFGHQQALEKHFNQILLALREKSPRHPGYLAGNILNILCQMNKTLQGYDFSYVSIYQAYLQGIELKDINFSHADFSRSVFTKIFGNILSVAFSPDGQLLATCDSSGEIHLWRVADTQTILTLRGHNNWVRAGTFSPNGQYLASSSDDHTVRIWCVDNGKCSHVLEGHTDRVRSVAFSPDGQQIASGGSDNSIRIWNVYDGECLRNLEGHSDSVWSVAFSPDGQTLASGSKDQTVKLWDSHTGECLNTLQGHSGRVLAVVFTPSGDMLASGSSDSTVKLWSFPDGSCLNTLTDHNNWVYSLAFHPNGQNLASSSGDRTVRLWDIRYGKCLNTLHGHNTRVWSVAFSPDGQILASGSEDQIVKLWDVHDGKSLNTLQGYTNKVWSVRFSPDGQNIASSYEDRIIRVWNVHDGNCLYMQGHTNRVWSVDFSPDGQKIVSGSEDQTVRVWNTLEEKSLHTFLGDIKWVLSVAFSPDGHIIASGSGDNAVRIWDAHDGKCIHTFYGHTNAVWSVAFSPDGKNIVSGSTDRTIRIWDVSTGKCSSTLQGHADRVWSVVFSPDGRRIASASGDHTVKIWAIHDGQCLNTYHGHTNWVLAVSFSPNGRLVASAGEDHTVRIWDLHDGKCLHILRGHTDCVYSVSFEPNSTILASGSLDSTIKLWDISSGTCFRTIMAQRPYEKINITGATGITKAHKATLQALGAIDNE